jgi:hypothetical protein
MASSMEVYCQIVSEGLAMQRRRNATAYATLIAAGVASDESRRRVYYPWKTLGQYHDMMEAYEARFGHTTAT